MRKVQGRERSIFVLTSKTIKIWWISSKLANVQHVLCLFFSKTLQDMKQSRFTEERIIAVLREQEAGSKTGDVCRKHGISSATFYKWKAKYGGLDVSEARRLKVLTDENAKLKKLLAEAMLDNAMLKDLNSKKW